MKHKLLISNVRKIKSSYKRFISLLFLAMLGVGFFVGIKAASPDMLKTVDSYLDEHNVYDIEIVSTLGLMEEDALMVKEMNVVSDAVLVKSIDEIINVSDQEKIIKVTSLSEVNDVILIDGVLPQSEDEIVVEKKVLSDNSLSIGDSILIDNDGLKNKTLRIVGVVESPIYFTTYRGTTNIGNGDLDYFSYVLEDAFNLDYYSSMYVILNGTRELITGSDEYVSLVNDASSEIEDIKHLGEDNRYNYLYSDTIEYMKSIGMEDSIQELQRPVWYIFDRTSNQGYNTFIDSAESVSKVGSVFPLVFYVVAILISLISMTRMVDEDRIEIGTLKGLGFSNIHIISKYVLYSSLATIIGGLLGMVIGFNLFPRVIWSVYQSLFYIPKFICEFNSLYAVIGILASIFCICGASVVTAYRTLKEKPSNLMRPKAPKIGKKILLERVTFFWSRLKFSNKITIRNIFRYKKRILVTIIGIAGSTSLILVGFGLKDSITSIVDYNYNNVFVYDEMISLRTGSEISSLVSLLDENDGIDSSVNVLYQVTNVYNKDKNNIEVNLIVPEFYNELSNVIKLNDINNDYEMIDLSGDYVVLSEKLARVLEVKPNDKVSFLINDEYKEFNVGYVVENYINDYVYMNREVYEEFFGDYYTNVIFLKTNDSYDSNFDKTIMNDTSVSNIISTMTTFNLIKNILSSLNSVVVILIVASACLAFVILYNLSNINISERKREISTLKVLGFYDEEVDAYITKENYFTTVIGIMIGLVCGLYLSYYVISTCELQYVMFIRHIELSSYVISACISLLFTIIVNKITHYNLKKIDMVESLKSNE